MLFSILKSILLIDMKKNIIFFANNDTIFTLPIILYLVKNLKSKFNIYIKLNKTSLKKKIKILLILFLDGSIFNLFKYYLDRVSVNKIIYNKDTYLIQNEGNKKFKYGFSVNYPKKIHSKKYKIYNFHLGNFANQRGTFIFYYNLTKKWKSINITLHQINSRFDSGPVLSIKKINIINKNCINIISEPLKNKKFYLKSIININNLKKIKIIKKGRLNNEPTFFNIFLSIFR